MQKKKILILIDWFAPGYKAGGPIQSCVNLCRALNKLYDIYVLTTDTDHGATMPYQDILANKWLLHDELLVNVYYAKKTSLTTKQLAEQVERLNADFIYLNHLFSPMFVLYPLWLKYRGKIKGKVVVCPRGALYQSALSLKSYKKKPLLLLYKYLGIRRLVSFHATNEREQAEIENYFPGAAIVVADNLPNTMQAPFESIAKESGSLNCIFIARIVPIKNLLFLLKILQQIISGKIALTVVGPVENETYWTECRNAIKELPENISVQYLGSKEHSALPALLRQHHLFVLPTTGENFGHSIFEALLAGRPVLISDQTPWLNLQQQNAGWDIALNEPGKFEAAIKTMLQFNQQQFTDLANGAWQYANDFIGNAAVTSQQQYSTLFS